VDNSHIQHQITDYLLDLLPDEEKVAVARHIAGCAACRLAVQKEREIGRLVYTTLNKATAPDYGRLQSLMPPRPRRRASILALLTPYRQWAVACLLLVFMTGAFLFGGDSTFGRLTQPATNQQATISSINVAGTAETITTSDAGTLFSPAVQPTIPAEQSRTLTENAPEPSNPPAAIQPASPQATPAPAATYFQ
jgi:predicted anti-sigma-YlaC factor YlaD